MVTPEVSLDSLFDQHRFAGKALQVFALSIYLPLGVCLALLRFCICLHALLVSALLPKTSVVRGWCLRIMCCVLGVGVQEKNGKLKDAHARVLVANHVTVFDHIIIELLRPCVLPSVWELPAYANWGFIYKNIRQGGSFQENISTFLTENPNLSVLSFPEAATTNGRKGLLAFTDVWAFSLAPADTAVQPVSITVNRPIFSFISATILESTWWSDLLWLFFTPFTLYTVSYLPSTSRGAEESAEDFAERVQQSIAADLNIVATKHRSRDKDELRKRQILDRRQRQQQVFKPQRTIMAQRLMAQQVKEVFPHIPLSVIERDLRETGDVDMTITRFLEGVVTFVPEPVAQETPATPKSTTSVGNAACPVPSTSSASVVSGSPSAASKSAASLCTAAPFFPKSAHERALSLQERKAALIESARMRYLAKHGDGGGNM